MKTLAKRGMPFLLLIFAIPIMAQINYGTLRGTVSDPSGGVVPGAEVTATDAATAAQYRSVTNGSGAYALLDLPLGTYTLSAQKEGFQTATQTGVTMNAGDNKTIDIALKVGSASVKVEVTGGAPALETTTGSFSESEDAETLLNLPLSAAGAPRSIGSYETVFPGFQGSPGFDTSINGSVATYSEVYVDGSSFLGNMAVHGLIRDTFSPEAVAETKIIQTPMADAGNTGGEAILYVTKSGANELHGAAYGYVRNTAFDSKCELCSKTSKEQNFETGGDIGGPVYIPHVYDGRNKTFFWFNYGYYHNNFSTSPTFYSLPTDAWKAGDFSDILGAQVGTDALGRPVLAGEIYNPYTTQTLPDGTVVRDPFPGNIVPSNLLSVVSSKYQALYPEPNLPGHVNNYFVGAGEGSVPFGSAPTKYWQLDLDQNISSKDRISGTYWNYRNPTNGTAQMPLFFVQSIDSTNVGNYIHVNWTHTFSPSLVHVIAAGLDRTIQHGIPSSGAKVGATTIGQPNALTTCTPGVAITNLTGTNRGDFSACTIGEGDTNFAINDNWTKSFGKHLTKWGFNLYRYNANNPSIWNLGAGFLAGQTALPNQAGTCVNCGNQTGTAYASFLLGAVHDATEQGYQWESARSLAFGFYVGDEFRITPKLTVTYGLRYDVQPVTVEAKGRTSQFNPTLPNPETGGLPGALTFAGHGPGTLNTKQLAPTQFLTTNLGPKFSVAYQIAPKTVLRGAWIMSYGPPDQTAEGFTTAYQQGYFPDFSRVSTDTFTPAYFWDSGFPLPVGVPLYNNFNPAIANGSNTGFFGKTADHAPRIQNIHADIEHEFPGAVVVSMNYNGSISHGILDSHTQEINQLNYAQYGALGNLLGDDISSAAAQAAGIPIPYAGFTGSVAQALRPFPQFASIENESAPLGFNDYNAGQVLAKKEYSNGLSFLVGYTFMKQLSNMNGEPGDFTAGPQNADNLGAEKSVYYASLPQQVLFNYTYELPIGRGKTVNVASRALDEAVGGWSIAGIHTYQSGGVVRPITEKTLPAIDNNLRPDVVPGALIRTSVSCGGLNTGNLASTPYLNVAAFTDPAPFTFGNARLALDHVRDCPSLNESISLFKTFTLTEGVKFKLGADFFNAFNRHQWGSPNSDIDSGAFGVITSQANSPRSIQLNGRLTF